MGKIFVRAIRGAINIEENTKKAILGATERLLKTIIEENKIVPEDIACVFFTLTPDLNAEFPALAARRMGWLYVPLLCAAEINVPQGMKGVLRVMVLVNTDKSQNEIKHIYLDKAAFLRPDLQE